MRHAPVTPPLDETLCEAALAFGRLLRLVRHASRRGRTEAAHATRTAYAILRAETPSSQRDDLRQGATAYVPEPAARERLARALEGPDRRPLGRVADPHAVEDWIADFIHRDGAAAGRTRPHAAAEREIEHCRRALDATRLRLEYGDARHDILTLPGWFAVPAPFEGEDRDTTLILRLDPDGWPRPLDPWERGRGALEVPRTAWWARADTESPDETARRRARWNHYPRPPKTDARLAAAARPAFFTPLKAAVTRHRAVLAQLGRIHARTWTAWARTRPRGPRPARPQMLRAWPTVMECVLKQPDRHLRTRALRAVDANAPPKEVAARADGFAVRARGPNTRHAAAALSGLRPAHVDLADALPPSATLLDWRDAARALRDALREDNEPALRHALEHHPVHVLEALCASTSFIRRFGADTRTPPRHRRPADARLHHDVTKPWFPVPFLARAMRRSGLDAVAAHPPGDTIADAIAPFTLVSVAGQVAPWMTVVRERLAPPPAWKGPRTTPRLEDRLWDWQEHAAAPMHHALIRVDPDTMSLSVWAVSVLLALTVDDAVGRRLRTRFPESAALADTHVPPPRWRDFADWNTACHRPGALTRAAHFLPYGEKRHSDARYPLPIGMRTHTLERLGARAMRGEADVLALAERENHCIASYRALAVHGDAHIFALEGGDDPPTTLYVKPRVEADPPRILGYVALENLSRENRPPTLARDAQARAVVDACNAALEAKEAAASAHRARRILEQREALGVPSALSRDALVQHHDELIAPVAAPLARAFDPRLGLIDTLIGEHLERAAGGAP